MIRDLGIVEPGTTLYLPFHTFDSNDPTASVTLTGLATSDIEIYKDGGTTQRASDSGYALLDTDGIDFDGVTGIHGLSINLADNTTAGFYAAGSHYWVVISSVTVDAATVNFVLATFRIGLPAATLNTTIATLSSQTSFTLTSGPAEDDALNGCWAVIHDVASAVQKSIVQILDYTGSTKTVTLAAGATFTAAATDNISIMGPMPLQPTTVGRTLAVDASGNASADLVLVDGATVDPAQAQLGVNVIQAAGTAWGSGAIGSGTFAADAITGTAAASSFWDEAETAAGVALAAIRLDELLAADSDIDGLTPPTTGSVFFELMSKSVGAFTFDQTTDSLEALRDLAATLGTQVSLDTIYDDMPTAAENGAAAATAVWSDNLGPYNTGQVGGALLVHLQDWLDGGRLDLILDARASQTSVNTIDDFLDTEIAAIKAKTDNLPAAPAAVGDIPTAIQNADALLNRSVTNTQDTADAHSLTTIILATLESSVSGTTWTIRKTGGTTFATKTLTVDAGADPVTGVT